MADIPTLTTPRLVLRPMQPDDWKSYTDFMHSDRARFMGGPFTDPQAWGMFCADHAQWDLFGCGCLMIDSRDSGACLGQVGINSGPLFPEQELGWFVLAEAEGQGYAFEAACALRDWARDVAKLRTLVSYVDPQNTRSRKLAERMGAARDKAATPPDPTDLVFRHFRNRPVSMTP